MASSVPDRVAKFETLVRVLNWENGLFVGIVALGYALAASPASSNESATSRSVVAGLAVVSGTLLLNMARYRLKSSTEPDLRSQFRAELLRQAQVRRRSLLFVSPLVLSLLINSWISESIFSLILAVVILGGQWGNAFLSRTWRQEALALDERYDAV